MIDTFYSDLPETQTYNELFNRIIDRLKTSTELNLDVSALAKEIDELDKLYPVDLQFLEDNK